MLAGGSGGKRGSRRVGGVEKRLPKQRPAGWRLKGGAVKRNIWKEKAAKRVRARGLIMRMGGIKKYSTNNTEENRGQGSTLR